MSESTPLAAHASEYVALDIEATGLNPAVDEVIEVAVIVFDADREIARFSQTVKPKRAVSQDILRLTGLSQDVLDVSPTFNEIKDELASLIGSRPIVGHNVAYDIAVLGSGGLKLPNRQLDTYRLATAILPDLPNYQLGTIAAILGYDLPAEKRHRAFADTSATMYIFRELSKRLEQYDAATLNQVAMFARAAKWPEASVFEAVAREMREMPLFGGDRPATVPMELMFLASRDRPEPLRPTGSDDPIDLDRLGRLLGDEGPLSRVLDGYESRPTQATMARRVAESLNNDTNLLVEAGTGTGKSLAYLLPSAVFALTRGERVVVSTATIALQDQLYRKDLPDVHTALVEAGFTNDLHVAVMKGRQNYLCLKQWFAHQGDAMEDEADAALRAKILLWLPQTETGDRAELRLTTEEERHWRKYASERGRCTASRCPYAASNQCFFHRARHNAMHAHIVIANHSLVLSNAAEGRVLPSFERLVVDEAHHLEDEATRQLSFVVDRASLEDAVKTLVRSEGAINSGAIPVSATVLAKLTDKVAIKHTDKARQAMNEAIDSFPVIMNLGGELFARLGMLVGKPSFGGGGGYAQSQRITAAMRDQGRFVDAALIWDELEGKLRSLVETGAWLLQVMDEVSLPNDETHPMVVQRDDAVVELMTGVDQLSDILRMLNEVFGDLQESKVYWVQRSGQMGLISLNGAPLDVSVLLNQYVYANLRSVIMTSATMTIDGSFDFIAEHLGLQNAKVLDLGSPFDHERSTLVFVPEDMPEPNDPRYGSILADILAGTLVATHGRALVLFTSHRALRDARNALKGPLEEHNIVVLGQGIDGSTRNLIERLRTEQGTVVFGTSSFWEGVDVVGDALSVLIITKFPFAVPSDPIFEARSELYDNPFMELSLPLAVLKFKQGFGRLIRTAQDRGICVILDKRAISKRYGSTFIQSLPPTNVTVGSAYDLPDAAAQWIGAATS